MGRSQEFAAVIQEFYLSSKPEKAPSCWDQNWANCTISLSNLVRVFQGLGAVIYSITLPEPWDSVWIVMGPGHRAFFPFDLPLLTIRLKNGPKYSSDTSDDADKGSNQGNACW